MLYGYICGGAETDAALRDNRRAFDEYGFVPRVLNDVSGREQTTELFGKTYAAPFGIPPMGSAALFAYRGDIVLTRAAAAMNVPMILSASSLITLEDVQPRKSGCLVSGLSGGRRLRGSSRWSTASPPPATTPSSSPPTCRCRPTARTTSATVFRSRSRSRRRSPATSRPIRIGCSATWARTLMNHGMPHFENMDAMRGPPVLAKNLMRNIGKRDQLAWKHVELIRKRWKGKLVVKGLIAPADARIARESGVDGVIVSNHGGRQLDHTVSALRTLPEIAAEASGMTVMLDGGIRRGTDVIKALALGAQFVFVGRPLLYAAVAGGEAGVQHALTLLGDEVDRDMALMGIRSIGEITPRSGAAAVGAALALAERLPSEAPPLTTTRRAS